MPPEPTANLYPDFAHGLPRPAKERLLGQRGFAVWFYGLSGSGKSTLAGGFERRLHDAGRYAVVLDADKVRGGLNAGLGFSDEDRAENIRRVAEVAKLFVDAGAIVLAAFITPREALRARIREIIGPDDVSLVYTKASFAACRDRDVKGLYAKVQAGGVAQFTGKDSAFEEPTGDDFVLNTEELDVEACLDTLQSRYGARFALIR